MLRVGEPDEAETPIKLLTKARSPTVDMSVPGMVFLYWLCLLGIDMLTQTDLHVTRFVSFFLFIFLNQNLLIQWLFYNHSAVPLNDSTYHLVLLPHACTCQLWENSCFITQWKTIKRHAELTSIQWSQKIVGIIEYVNTCSCK